MRSEKVLFYSTGVLLSLIGIGAIAAGIGFIVQPDGSSLGISLDYLKDSPFNDYLIPGIVLLCVNGIASIIGASFAFAKKHYAGIFTMILGLVMLVWIAAQVYWMGWSSWLQPTFLAVGVVEIIAGFFMYDALQDHQVFFHTHHGSPSH